MTLGRRASQLRHLFDETASQRFPPLRKQEMRRKAGPWRESETFSGLWATPKIKLKKKKNLSRPEMTRTMAQTAAQGQREHHQAARGPNKYDLTASPIHASIYLSRNRLVYQHEGKRGCLNKKRCWERISILKHRCRKRA